ncbi:MAG: MFS transporter, partial [Acidimicrobiales bacterium]
AQQLPGPLSADLLDAAGASFTTGLNAVGGVGSAIFVGMAILAAVALRHVRPSGESLQADESAVGTSAAPVGVEESLVGGVDA